MASVAAGCGRACRGGAAGPAYPAWRCAGGRAAAARGHRPRRRGTRLGFDVRGRPGASPRRLLAAGCFEWHGGRLRVTEAASWSPASCWSGSRRGSLEWAATQPARRSSVVADAQASGTARPGSPSRPGGSAARRPPLQPLEALVAPCSAACSRTPICSISRPPGRWSRRRAACRRAASSRSSSRAGPRQASSASIIGSAFLRLRTSARAGLPVTARVAPDAEQIVLELEGDPKLVAERARPPIDLVRCARPPTPRAPRALDQGGRLAGRPSPRTARMWQSAADSSARSRYWPSQSRTQVRFRRSTPSPRRGWLGRVLGQGDLGQRDTARRRR